MKTVIWLVLVALVLLHHDYWFWDDPTLVGGWMPVGMLYHIGLSLAASAFWFAAVKFAWPAADGLTGNAAEGTTDGDEPSDVSRRQSNIDGGASA